jgi:AcrR family transcriptional regulator
VGAVDRKRDADAACRRRITQAIAELAHEQGMSGVSAGRICQRAAISAADLDRAFPSTADALRNAFAEAFDSLFDPIGEAVAAAPDWLNGLAQALDALLEVAGREPRLAELCLVHSLEAPEASAAHDYIAAVEAIGALVRTARTHAEAGAEHEISTPPIAEEFLAHGILSRAGDVAMRDERVDLRDRRNDLLILVLLAFLPMEDATRMCDEVA